MHVSIGSKEPMDSFLLPIIRQGESDDGWRNIRNGPAPYPAKKNTIMIGKCVFTLQYSPRDSDEEEQFQIELRQFSRQCYGEHYPLILPTPGENDFRFEDWIFQQLLSRGAFGVVHMVINARTGRPAAAKRILKSKRNEYSVDREIRMARRISEFTHVSCDPLSPLGGYNLWT